jgi:hypothetical protein
MPDIRLVQAKEHFKYYNTNNIYMKPKVEEICMNTKSKPTAEDCGEYHMVQK